MEQQKQVSKLLNGKVSVKEIAEFIDNLPANIRAMLPKDEHALLDCIELLPNSISKGRILKITIDNFLDCDDEFGKTHGDDRTGTSSGLLYALDDNAEIKVHPHYKDMEIYVSLQKVLKMPPTQQDLSANICAIGQKHGIGPMPKGTLIGTFKIRKDCLKNQVQSVDRPEPGPLYKEKSKKQGSER